MLGRQGRLRRDPVQPDPGGAHRGLDHHRACHHLPHVRFKSIRSILFMSLAGFFCFNCKLYLLTFEKVLLSYNKDKLSIGPK